MTTEEKIEDIRESIKFNGYCCMRRRKDNKKYEPGFFDKNFNFYTGCIFDIDRPETIKLVPSYTPEQVLADGWKID
jgi:hypothetical protein